MISDAIVAAIQEGNAVILEETRRLREVVVRAPQKASKLSIEDYQLFSPVEVISEELVKEYKDDEKLPAVINLLKNFDDNLRIMRNPSENDTKSIIRTLIGDTIWALNVPVECRTARSDIAFAVNLDGKTVTGETDVSIYHGNVLVSTWESKKRNVTISQIKFQAQALVQVESAARAFKLMFNREPMMICGMLTNGQDWTLFTRIFDEAVVWRKTEIVNAETHRTNVACLLLEYFAVANALSEDCDKYRTINLNSLHRKRTLDNSCGGGGGGGDKKDGDENDDGGGGDGDNSKKPKVIEGTSPSVFSQLTATNLHHHNYVSFTRIF